MKILLLLGVFLVASSARAEKCQITTSQLATILLNVSEKLVEIKAKGFSQSGNEAPECETIEDGVSSYTLHFQNSGLSLPLKATLTVIEDERPSWADGPVIYGTKIEYGK